MEIEATKENISTDERIGALSKIMQAKDDEVNGLQNRIVLLQDRLKSDIIST